MTSKQLPRDIVVKRMIRTIIPQSFILTGVGIFFIVQSGSKGFGFALGVGCFIFMGFFESYCVIRILKTLECPTCHRWLERSLAESGFQCVSCQTHWVFPGSK